MVTRKKVFIVCQGSKARLKTWNQNWTWILGRVSIWFSLPVKTKWYFLLEMNLWANFRDVHPCWSLLETDLSDYAIHDVSAVLKDLLRHLPEPLFPYKTYHDVIEILQYRQSPLFRLKELNHLIKQLSEVRRYVIGKIIYHLAVISSKSNHNRMNSKSLGRFQNRIISEQKFSSSWSLEIKILKPIWAIIFGPVLLRAPLETPLELVAAQNHCCVKAIELLIEQELSKQRKIKEEQLQSAASSSYKQQQLLMRRITVKRFGRLKNERRYKTDRINQNQVHEALRGNIFRSHSSPPTLRNTNAYVQNDQRMSGNSKCPVFDFTDLKRGDQSEGIFTLKRNQKGRLPVRRKKKVWFVGKHVYLFIWTMGLIIW